MEERYVGTSVRRKEDPALLTGRANWTDNIKLPGMLHMDVLRSPHTHAKINELDVSRALERPGVVAAFTGEDLAGEWAISIPCGWPVTEDIKVPDHWPLARGEVNHVGEAVAVVIATDRYKARDALQFVEVDYEPMQAVVDVEQALEEGSPLVHEQFGTNYCYTWPLGTGDIDDAFEKADVVVRGRYIQQRLIPSAIEPRAVVVNPEPVNGGFTVYTSTQVPHFVRDLLALMCSVPDSKLRVVAPDVGGGFGYKLNVYAEEALALSLARKLGAPVKWVEDRSENHVATTHGRGQVQYMELASTRDGKILGMKVRLVADMGAYLQLLTPGIAIFGSFTYPGLYTFGAYSFECTGVFSNLTPTDAYRGAGRSEAAYAHERIMDDLAGRRDVRLRRLRGLYEKGPGPRRLRRATRRTEEAPRVGRCRTDRHRHRQLHRERGTLALQGRRRGAVAERGMGGGERQDARLRQGPGRHRHLAARPGPRNGLVPARRRRTRRGGRGRRGPARRHRRRPDGPRHLRLQKPPRRRCCGPFG